MKQIKRNYKVRFSINIGDKKDKNFYNYLRFYIPKWSEFIGPVMRYKLSTLPSNGTTSVCELPAIRDCLKCNNVTTQQVIHLLNQKRPELARMLLDTALLFDKCPIALKAHILAVFGVTEMELKAIPKV